MNLHHEEIGRLIRHLNEAWKSGRTDQLNDLFHTDMVMVGPGFQELVRGRAACVESYREFAANAKVHDYTESDFKIGVWGDAAICTYSWSMTYERAGEQSRETGTDQFVLSRQADKWLIVYRYIYFEPTKAN
jgi:uncharacterized protein (TIGR02246 family)